MARTLSSTKFPDRINQSAAVGHNGVPALSRRGLLCGAAGALVTCTLPGCGRKPRIEFTRIPAADKGGPEIVDKIEGRVIGAKPNHRLVIFAKSEGWWVQPGVNQPYTAISPKSTWSGTTHLGTEYAVLLVDPSYRPPAMIHALPKEGGAIVAIVAVPGDPSKKAVRNILQFAGYDWTVRASPSDRGGKNLYDPKNAWVDSDGALHLRIAPSSDEPGKWTCAQVLLKSSLGYGTYRFVVRDVSQLDPAAVLAIYTWDGAKALEQNPREWDIEFSRWGDGANKNARYMIQPYHLPDHTERFEAPAGALSHSLHWESDRATFKTVRGSDGHGKPVHEHAFTSGVPRPANEKLRFNFYDFQRGPKPLAEGAEAVIERFEFFP